MSLIPTIYSSTNAGAPQLTGQAGALLNVLRAILVTGYGTSPNNIPPLGWAEEFTGTNKAVFRNSAVSGTGYRLRLDDSDARYARLRAYSSMSDIDTGSDPTPTTAMQSNGIYWVKSQTADAVARAWWAIGNERCFYIFIDSGNGGIANAAPRFAGDISTIRPADLHHFMVSANATLSDSLVDLGSLFITHSGSWSAPSSSNACGALGRNHAQAIGSIWGGNPAPQHSSSTNQAYGSAGSTYPCPVNGGLLHQRAPVIEAAFTPRGVMPGVYVPLHNRPVADLASLADVTGFPSGTTLIAKSFRGYFTSNARDGQVLFDMTNAW